MNENDRVIVYLTNQHPFYMGMVANSLTMLRKYNRSEKVRLYLIEDGRSQTVQRNNMAAGTVSEDQLTGLCGELDVEIVRRPPLHFPGEEGYFMINRHYLKEVPEKTVLYMDGDTFFFGDVGPMFDKYQGVDLAACSNDWVVGHNWKPELLPMFPYNSGVMFWYNGWCQRWAEKLPDLCRELRTSDTPLISWLYSHSPVCAGREEFSVSVFVARNGLSHTVISTEDCWLNKNQEDVQRLGKSVIFHSYTDQWRRVYGHLNAANKQRRVFKYVKKE